MDVGEGAAVQQGRTHSPGPKGKDAAPLGVSGDSASKPDQGQSQAQPQEQGHDARQQWQQWQQEEAGGTPRATRGASPAADGAAATAAADAPPSGEGDSACAPDAERPSEGGSPTHKRQQRASSDEGAEQHHAAKRAAAEEVRRVCAWGSVPAFQGMPCGASCS
jgi:hypothetical protein